MVGVSRLSLQAYVKKKKIKSVKGQYGHYQQGMESEC